MCCDSGVEVVVLVGPEGRGPAAGVRPLSSRVGSLRTHERRAGHELAFRRDRRACAPLRPVPDMRAPGRSTKTNGSALELR